MRPVFEILPNVLSLNTEHSELFVEVSTSGISYAIQTQKDNSFCGVALYHFDKKNNPAEIAKEIDEAFNNHSIVNNTFARVTIIYAFPESMLVPSKNFNKQDAEKGLTKLFGDLYESKVLTDDIESKEIINVYRVPLEVEKVILEEFPEHRSFHQSGLLARESLVGGHRMKAIFHPRYLTVIVSKESKLQLIQEYKFESLEDATWQLLNIAERFELKDPILELAGMINKDSALFQELRKYFKIVEFDKLPSEITYEESIKELPEHFFSYLFSSALCV